MLASSIYATCKIDGTKRQSQPPSPPPAPSLITARTRRGELREIVTWRVYHRRVVLTRNDFLRGALKSYGIFLKRGPQEEKKKTPPPPHRHHPPTSTRESFVENDAVEQRDLRCTRTRVATVITELTWNTSLSAPARIFSGNDNRFRLVSSERQRKFKWKHATTINIKFYQSKKKQIKRGSSLLP